MLTFAAPQYAWFLAMPAGIVVLYLLRRKYLPKQVSSTFLWRAAIRDHAANKPLQRLRKSLVRFTLGQHGEDAVTAAQFQEVMQFFHAPFGLEIARRADADEPFGLLQRFVDVAAQIGGQRKFFLVAEDAAHLRHPLRFLQ